MLQDHLPSHELGRTLQGLLVVELASVLAGPSVGQFLAELGARVIKIERPDAGDVTRSWMAPGQTSGAMSAYFASCNYGKESVVLDLQLDAQRNLLRRLIDVADVVTMSFRPGTAERFGLDAESMRKRNPGLIVGRLSGYGSASERPGYDAVIQAESGFMSMNGTPESGPLKMPVALVDVLAAHQLKEGILVALLRRASSGQGAIIDVSLLDTAISSLVNQATNFLATGRIPERIGSAHPNISPYGSIFQDRSGEPLVLAVGTNEQFTMLCRIVGCPDLSLDGRFRTNELRATNRSDLERALADAIRKFDRDGLLDRLHEAGVPAGAVRNLKSVFSEDAAQDIVLGSTSAGASRGLRQVVFHGTTKRELGPPPVLGQDTRPVLQEFCHLTDSELDAIARATRDH